MEDHHLYQLRILYLVSRYRIYHYLAQLVLSDEQLCRSDNEQLYQDQRRILFESKLHIWCQALLSSCERSPYL